jgi:hypothetical protein
MDPKDTIHPKEISADDRGASFKGKSGELVTESNQVSLFDREEFGIIANAIPALPQRLDEKTLGAIIKLSSAWTSIRKDLGLPSLQYLFVQPLPEENTSLTTTNSLCCVCLCSSWHWTTLFSQPQSLASLINSNPSILAGMAPPIYSPTAHCSSYSANSTPSTILNGFIFCPSSFSRLAHSCAAYRRTLLF